MPGREEEQHADVRGTHNKHDSLLSPVSSSEEDIKTYFITEALFESLKEKGFGDNAIKKSIVAGCIDEGTCTQWITMHEGHPSLDTPLDDGVEVIVKAKRVLTEVERMAKVRELQEKVKLKKEEAKKLAAEEERKRIAMGKKALEAHEMREKLLRESDLAAVRKQKEDDAIARHRVRLQILADKYVRQGMSIEEARRAAEMEFEETTRKKREQLVVANENRQEGITGGATQTSVLDVHNVTTRELSFRDLFDEPVEPPSSLPRLVQGICNSADAVMARQCIGILRTILTNIRDHPFDSTKRSLKTSTNAFCTKIAPVPPAIHVLRTCGFQLAADANGNEMVTAPTIVIRVIEQALELLSQDVDA